jgi:NAD(P)-dependent dehydrogenase (short-subunit alcohol dehydrogenase family)
MRSNDSAAETTDGTVAVVTGASAGIGRATAVELARRGHRVVLTYRGRQTEASEVVEQIRADGGTAAALQLDVAAVDSFPAFRGRLDAVLAEWGADTIDVLVNNAGIGGGRDFATITERQFDDYLGVLFRGPYFLTQSLLPLLADGASVVIVSSSSVHEGDTHAGYSAYAGAKAGLAVASRYLAKELSPRGIRVNTVSPGPTRTRLGDDAFSKYPEIINGLAERTALGRIGEPEDIAAVIGFLASAQSGWVTGTDILATGGYAL